MSFKLTIINSCQGDNKISSKRIIMYIFTFVAVGMIFVESIFNILLIFKCYSNAENVIDCDFSMVFDSTIYGYIFALIAALAGINGFSKQPINEPKETQPV